MNEERLLCCRHIDSKMKFLRQKKFMALSGSQSILFGRSPYLHNGDANKFAAFAYIFCLNHLETKLFLFKMTLAYYMEECILLAKLLWFVFRSHQVWIILKWKVT
jgi:hypothetical protein